MLVVPPAESGGDFSVVEQPSFFSFEKGRFFCGKMLPFMPRGSGSIIFLYFISV